MVLPKQSRTWEGLSALSASGKGQLFHLGLWASAAISCKQLAERFGGVRGEGDDESLPSP